MHTVFIYAYVMFSLNPKQFIFKMMGFRVLFAALFSTVIKAERLEYSINKAIQQLNPPRSHIKM